MIEITPEEQEIVQFALEIVECTAQAVNLERSPQKKTRFRGGLPSPRGWALDVVRRLPDDRKDAVLILRAHNPQLNPAEWDQATVRRAGKLCQIFYNQLETAGLLRQGRRLLKARR